MKKVVGYVVAIVGLVVMAFGFNIIPLKIAFLEGVAGNYISGAGIILVIVGAILSTKGTSSSKKVKNATEEVPIYQGTGKNRKIVGYRKD